MGYKTGFFLIAACALLLLSAAADKSVEELNQDLLSGATVNIAGGDLTGDAQISEDGTITCSGQCTINFHGKSIRGSGFSMDAKGTIRCLGSCNVDIDGNSIRGSGIVVMEDGTITCESGCELNYNGKSVTGSGIIITADGYISCEAECKIDSMAFESVTGYHQDGSGFSFASAVVDMDSEEAIVTGATGCSGNSESMSCDSVEDIYVPGESSAAGSTENNADNGVGPAGSVYDDFSGLDYDITQMMEGKTIEEKLQLVEELKSSVVEEFGSIEDLYERYDNIGSEAENIQMDIKAAVYTLELAERLKQDLEASQNQEEPQEEYIIDPLAYEPTPEYTIDPLAYEPSPGFESGSDTQISSADNFHMTVDIEDGTTYMVSGAESIETPLISAEDISGQSFISDSYANIKSDMPIRIMLLGGSIVYVQSSDNVVIEKIDDKVVVYISQGMLSAPDGRVVVDDGDAVTWLSGNAVVLGVRLKGDSRYIMGDTAFHNKEGFEYSLANIYSPDQYNEDNIPMVITASAIAEPGEVESLYYEGCIQCGLVDHTEEDRVKERIIIKGVIEYERLNRNNEFVDIIDSRSTDNDIRICLDQELDIAENVVYTGTLANFYSGAFEVLKDDGETYYSYPKPSEIPYVIRRIESKKEPDITISRNGILRRQFRNNVFLMYDPSLAEGQRFFDRLAGMDKKAAAVKEKY
ncbi:hypothetical protein JXB31_03665 [Candidatus Woesearchaeota archaeon]|nr:hypothetical protein [Candidatus Woesearchaeota archaeon]